MKAVLASLVVSIFSLSASADYFCSLESSFTFADNQNISTLILIDDGDEYTTSTLLGSDTSYSLQEYTDAESLELNQFLDISVKSTDKIMSSDAENGSSYYHFNSGDRGITLALEKITYDVAGEQLSEINGTATMISTGYDEMGGPGFEATKIECKEISLKAK